MRAPSTSRRTLPSLPLVLALPAILLVPEVAAGQDGPEVEVSPATVDAQVYRGTLEQATTLTLSNAGVGDMEWEALVVSGGLTATFTPASGTLASGETVAIELMLSIPVNAGDYTGSVGIWAPEAANGQLEIPVMLTVLDNAVPSAVDQVFTGSQHAGLEIVLDYSDDDAPGEPLSITVSAPPAHGVLTWVSEGVYTYTPDADFFGVDAFAWNVDDGLLSSPDATATVGINALPTASDSEATTRENEPVAIDLIFDDPDRLPGPHAIKVLAQPGHGTVAEVGFGSYLYTPDPDYFGPDSFTWSLSDGQDDSATGTVAITVEGVPEVAVTPSSIGVEIYRGTPEHTTTLTLVNEGVGEMEWEALVLGGGLTAAFTPTAGTLGAGQAVAVEVVLTTMVDAGEFTGSIGFWAPDASNLGVEIPVSLTVLDNEAPDAYKQLLTGTKNTPLEFTLSYSDDGFPNGTYVFSIVDAPTEGALVATDNGVYEYVPGQDYYGEDSFTWQVSDGLLDSTIVTAAIGVNSPPLGFDQEAWTFEDEPVGIELEYEDVDGMPGPHSIEIVETPLHGIFEEVEFGRYVYTPDEDYVGSDELRWALSDGHDTSDEATVTLDVTRRTLTANFAQPVPNPSRSFYGLNRGLDDNLEEEYFSAVPIGFFRASLASLEGQATRVLTQFPDARVQFLIYPKPYGVSAWNEGGGGDKDRPYDPHNECVRDVNGDCPPSEMNWSSLDSHLDDLFSEVEQKPAWLAAIDEGRFYFGIWNEAINGVQDFDAELGSWNFKGTEADYFATWQHMNNRVKSRFPGGKTCGPSYGSHFSFDEGGGRNGRLASFMEFVKETGTEVDALCLHAIANTPRRFEEYATRTEEYRDLYVNDTYGIEEIHIEENLSENVHADTAAIVGMINWNERASADAVGKDSWDDSNDGSFGGLLTPEQEPRAGFWAVKAYGEMLSGRRAADSGGDVEFPIFASVNDGVGKVLFAKYAEFLGMNDEHETELVLEGLSELGVGPYTVTVEHLDDSVTPLPVPPVIATETTDEDSFSLVLAVEDHDAYIVTVVAGGQ